MRKQELITMMRELDAQSNAVIDSIFDRFAFEVEMLRLWKMFDGKKPDLADCVDAVLSCQKWLRYWAINDPDPERRKSCRQQAELGELVWRKLIVPKAKKLLKRYGYDEGSKHDEAT